MKQRKNENVNKGGYSIRKFKSFTGMEGLGFNAELCHNGRPVCFVIDEANGGEFNYQWYDWKAERVPLERVDYQGKKFTYKATPDEAQFLAFLASLPSEKNEWDDKFSPVDDDSFMAAFVDDYESEKQVKRWCKTKTVFRLKGDPDGEYHTIKQLFNQNLKDWLVKKHGDKLEEILNERFAA